MGAAIVSRMDQNSNQELWSAVDDYLAAALIVPDEALDAALAATGAAGLPAMRASSILEIGTLAGYSTIWLARALPADGRLVTLEVDPRHAEVATANIERAGFGSRVQVVVGKALDTLPVVAGAGPFDLFFIDADKANIPEYVRWALRLSRPGSGWRG